MQAVDDDHRRMAEELGKRELDFAVNRPALERQRSRGDRDGPDGPCHL